MVKTLREKEGNAGYQHLCLFRIFIQHWHHLYKLFLRGENSGKKRKCLLPRFSPFPSMFSTFNKSNLNFVVIFHSSSTHVLVSPFANNPFFAHVWSTNLLKPQMGGSVVSVSDSWPGGCKFDPWLKRLFFPVFFRLSPLQKHVRKVVGGLGKESCVNTSVRKPGNICASPTAMIWLQQ